MAMLFLTVEALSRFLQFQTMVIVYVIGPAVLLCLLDRH